MAQKHGQPEPRDRNAAATDEAAALEAAYGALAPQEIVAAAVNQFWTGEIAAVSSFGADWRCCCT